MSEKVASAGNKGEKVRSDCFVELTLTTSGGVQIDLDSKVKSLYGQSIRELVKNLLAYYGIENVQVTLEDTGALPLVIMARLEAAVRNLTDSEKEYLPPFIEENIYGTKKEQFRLSRLYLPGNTPKMMLNAGIHHPSGIILDLEDSVSPEKKEEARLLVRNALRAIDFYGAERMVRINQLPEGLNDLRYVIPHNVHVILIPKCESAAQIVEVEEEINQIEKANNLSNPVFLMPIIESALGVERAFDLARASENVVAMAIGLEDYTASIGAQRTAGGNESFFARTRLVNASRAAGIQPIDSVFSDVSDEEGLRSAVRESKSLGFEGMGCIHPRQIRIIHEEFSPGREEIEHAAEIVEAYHDARKKGLGVVSLGSKMIDLPVVKRAQKTLELAKNQGLIS
jgi:citrate lyase subunit beta/citryl-CoA lyase